MLPTSERGPKGGEKVFLPRDSKIFVDIWAMQHDRKSIGTASSWKADVVIDSRGMEGSVCFQAR